MARADRSGAGWLLLLLLVGCRERPPALGTPAAERQPVEVRAAVDRAVATTGDLITFTLTVDHRADIAVEIPEIGAEIAGFRIVDLGREAPEERGDRVVESRWYRLRADLVGSYVLPPVEVAWRPADEPAATPQAVATSELFLEVASVLPEGEEVTDIRELKPLRPPMTPPTWLYLSAGGGLALLGLVGWLLWRRHRRLALAPPPPPHEIAFAALERLRATDFGDPEAVRRYHFALSEVVRSYVEGRWALNATDLTTEEILAALEQDRPLASEQAGLLRDFLLATDRVKFAAHRPTAEEIENVYEGALSFVEATRPRAEPAQELAA